MLTTIDDALQSALGFLKALSRDATRPPVAMGRLKEIARQHPNLDLQLLWEEQAYDGSLHYDILIREPGAGTVSLGFCSEQTLPWPMRGVQRWSDQDLLSVNATKLKIEEAIALLDFIWEERSIMRRLVDACLIREALHQDPIDLSADELQRAMDGFRRAHKLYSAEDTYRWLARRGMSHAQLEQHVSQMATIAKLRQQVIADRADGDFEAWLDERRQGARIAWNWGRADQTGADAESVEAGACQASG